MLSVIVWNEGEQLIIGIGHIELGAEREVAHAGILIRLVGSIVIIIHDTCVIGGSHSHSLIRVIIISHMGLEEALLHAGSGYAEHHAVGHVDRNVILLLHCSDRSESESCLIVMQEYVGAGHDILQGSIRGSGRESLVYRAVEVSHSP